MMEALFKLLLSYALGNLMGGAVVGWLRGGVDLRRLGSGNVGATNALRTQGPWFALAVLTIDIAKGVLAVLGVAALPWPLASTLVLPQLWLSYLCGIAVTLGHCYPLTLDSGGGKGVAVLAGVLAALMPLTLLAAGLGFAAVTLLSGYASLGTLAAAAITVLAVILFDSHGPMSATGLFTLLVVLFVVFKHRPNLRRLLDGSENRFRRPRIPRSGEEGP